MSAAVPRVGIRAGRVHRRPGVDLLYRLNRFALYTLLLSYVPLVIGVAAGTLVALFYLDRYLIRALFAGEGPSALAVIAAGAASLVGLVFAGLCLFGLLPLFFRRVDEPPHGLRLNARENPKLFALLERIAKRLGIAVPDQCLIGPTAQASVADLSLETRRGGPNRERVLILGAGLIVHMSVAEITTILCHEMVHAATGDTRLGRLAERFLHSLFYQIHHCLPSREADDPDWPSKFLLILLLAYLRLYELLYAADSGYRELRADRVAAEVCGPQNVRNMLVKLGLVIYVPELSIEALLEHYVADQRDIHNLYQEHRRRWAELTAARREAAETAMFLRPTSRWDSHPSFSDRIRNLADIEARELVADQPATSLFRAWEGIEERMTAGIMDWGRWAFQNYLRELDWAVRLGR